MAHYELITCTFTGNDAQTRAEAAAQHVAQQFPHLKDTNVAQLYHAEDGAVLIHETAEVREQTRGTAAGMVAGWLLGFANALVGTGLGPAQGAPLGAAVAQEAMGGHDSGFSDVFLHELGEALRRGEAAVLVMSRHDDTGAVNAALSTMGGTVSTRAITPDLLALLRA